MLFLHINHSKCWLTPEKLLTLIKSNFSGSNASSLIKTILKPVTCLLHCSITQTHTFHLPVTAANCDIWCCIFIGQASSPAMIDYFKSSLFFSYFRAHYIYLSVNMKQTDWLGSLSGHLSAGLLGNRAPLECQSMMINTVSRLWNGDTTVT